MHSGKLSQDMTQLRQTLRSISYRNLQYLPKDVLQQAEAHTNAILIGEHVSSTANLNIPTNLHLSLIR